MRTRSQAGTEAIDNTPSPAASDKRRSTARRKRKRKEDDSAAGDGGHRGKRQRVQSQVTHQAMASQGKSPREKTLHSSANAATEEEVLPASAACRKGDDEPCAMTLEKFEGDPCKSRAARSRFTSQDSNSNHPHSLSLSKRAGRASPSATGKNSSASLKEAISKRHGVKESLALIPAGEQREPCGNEHLSRASTVGDAVDSSDFGSNVHTQGDDVQHHEENLSVWQGGLDEQENLTSSYDEPIHHGEDCHQIVEPSTSPQEMAGIQSQEDTHQNEANPTLTQERAEKRRLRSHRESKGASICRNPIGRQLEKSHKSVQEALNPPGSHTTSTKRRSEEQPHSRPRPHQMKCRPGSIKRAKNQKKESTVSLPIGVPKKPNSCISRRRLDAAKLRWKNLAQSILNTKILPETPASARNDLEEHSEQLICVENRQSYETQPVPRRRKKPLAERDPSAAGQMPVAWRMQQKVRKQQLSLQKGVKSWLTKAGFSQSAEEQNSNGMGEVFIMTEDERNAFAQTMVKSCQKNTNMRTLFLESVRMLTLSGLMQAAASNLLQEGSCEEVQLVTNAWADFKEQSTVTKELPMNLLNAVNQLHERRGDLSTKLSTLEDSGICTLSQIDEKTWKFHLPGFPVEDENFMLPSGNESLQNGTPL